MRYQEKEWSCGAGALVNAARVMGTRVSERRVRSLAGTNEEGTDEKELITAAREMGFTASPHFSHDRVAAWSFVRANVLDGRPCLLCVDSWNHWVTVVGIVGDRVLLADPANTVKNTAENGVWSLSRNDLLKRWACPREDEPFYAIAVGR